MFFGQKTPFLATKFLFSATDCPLRGGEYPLPLSINFFPLTFRENVVRDGLGAEVNISSRNQYFCTWPKMALHGFPGRLGSWTVIFLHEAQKRQYFCTGSPKKFSVHNWKSTSLHLQCITSSQCTALVLCNLKQPGLVCSNANSPPRAAWLCYT